MHRNIYNKAEQLLKSWLKGKKKLTKAVIISYLMTGSFSLANDEVINIDAPNNYGVSHNKFDEFSINKEQTKILNNSNKDAKSQVTQKEIKKNEKLNGKEADIIIAEVTGTKKTNLEGTLEVLGKRADLIIANENGITLNGQRFVNTNSVGLTTQKHDWTKDRNSITSHFNQNEVNTFKDKHNNLLIDTTALNIQNGQDIFINLGNKDKTNKRTRRSLDFSISENGDVSAEESIARPRSRRATRSVSGDSVGEFEEISFELTEVESKKNQKELEKK